VKAGTGETNPRSQTGSEAIKLLSVSPNQDDHRALERLLCGSNWAICKANTLASGVVLLRGNKFPLVVCEQNLFPDSWREMLEQIALLAKPPYLVVTSRLADDYLWAEALNLGAYDVLPKPFETAEVERVLGSAWLHWNWQYGVPMEPLKAANPAAP
jgi:DNA-binding response OmpR family regulator